MSAVRLPEVVVGREASVRNVRAGELPIAKLLPKSVKGMDQGGSTEKDRYGGKRTWSRHFQHDGKSIS